MYKKLKGAAYTEKDMAAFDKAAGPLVKWMKKHSNPMSKAIVTIESASLSSDDFGFAYKMNDGGLHDKLR